jgi:hypothetical protein
MKPSLVIFNVGGQRYEVSNSLLAMHPDTMLARSASKEWKTDESSEIFLERNGTRFQFVLDYLRDGKVSLPLIVSKASILDELIYYGVENINEAAIAESTPHGLHFSMSSTYMHEELTKMKHDGDFIVVARACVQ